MAAAVSIAGNFVPVMFLERQRFGKLHCCAIANHLVIQQGDEAAFSEVVDLPSDFAVCVGRHILVNPSDQIRDSRNVLDLGIANVEPLLAELF